MPGPMASQSLARQARRRWREGRGRPFTRLDRFRAQLGNALAAFAFAAPVKRSAPPWRACAHERREASLKPGRVSIGSAPLTAGS